MNSRTFKTWNWSESRPEKTVHFILTMLKSCRFSNARLIWIQIQRNSDYLWNVFTVVLWMAKKRKRIQRETQWRQGRPTVTQHTEWGEISRETQWRWGRHTRHSILNENTSQEKRSISDEDKRKRNTATPRASHWDTAYLTRANLKRNTVTPWASLQDTASLMRKNKRETQQL